MLHILRASSNIQDIGCHLCVYTLSFRVCIGGCIRKYVGFVPFCSSVDVKLTVRNPINSLWLFVNRKRKLFELERLNVLFDCI